VGKKVKNEDVFISFHSMSRVQGPTSEAKRIKFTIEDISRLHSHLEEMEKLNLQDEATADKVRYRNLAPIIKRHYSRR